MRAIAVVLLVSYHAVGPDAAGGLQVDYPHLLRFTSDFFLDVRMPVFAFIAGYLYSLRPLFFPRYRAFVVGKFWRIYVPGMVASVVFALAAGVLGADLAVETDKIWRVLFYSYAHFWFLQSIFVIFVVYGLVDAVLRGRFVILLLVASFVWYRFNPVTTEGFMSISSAFYLLPFFLLGVLTCRSLDWLRDHARLVILAAAVVFAATTAISLLEFHQSGRLSLEKRNLQSLGAGLSICLLLFFCLPRIKLLELLRPYAFTIYLYHVFGTSGGRRLAEFAGVQDVWLQWLAAMTVGLLLPVALHQVVSRLPRVRQLVLGR